MNLHIDHGEQTYIAEDFPILENEFDEMGFDNEFSAYACNSEEDSAALFMD